MLPSGGSNMSYPCDPEIAICSRSPVEATVICKDEHVESSIEIKITIFLPLFF